MAVEVITEYSSEVLLVETIYDDDRVASGLIEVDWCSEEVLFFDPVGWAYPDEVLLFNPVG